MLPEYKFWDSLFSWATVRLQGAYISVWTYVWFWEEVDEWSCHTHHDLGCLYDISEPADSTEFEMIY